ncbi:MAG: hypothetical protein ACKOVH_06440 [Actinomycetota bacterium]
MIPFMIPAEHYEAHIALEADLSSSAKQTGAAVGESATESWPQDKVDFWWSTSGTVSRKVFDYLANVSPEVKGTSEIAQQTGLPVKNVRAVFATLGRRVKRNKRLQGSWPIHGVWGGQEVLYDMDPDIAARWKSASERHS